MSTHAVVIVELDEQKMRAINNVIGASFHRMPLDFIKKETYHGYELPYATKLAGKSSTRSIVVHRR